MSKRLQVLFEEDELREIREVARNHRMTVAAWVRQTLRAAYRQEPRRSARHKLALVRDAARYNFPTADIEEMLNEIEQGYREALPR